MAKKTTQALKISASWTPGDQAGSDIRATLFGQNSPLRVDGGRLLIRAAIAFDMTDPDHVVRVSMRAKDRRNELGALGKIHAFATQARAVPAALAEHLPNETKTEDDQ